MGNESFWVFVAFVIFISGVYRLVRKALAQYLDLSIESVASSIHAAEILRDENTQLLAIAQEKKNNAQQDVSKIILHAKNESKRIEKLLQDQRSNLMHHAQNLVQKRYELGLAEIENQLYRNISIKAFENIKNKTHN